jgi:hypothetical protein
MCAERSHGEPPRLAPKTPADELGRHHISGWMVPLSHTIEVAPTGNTFSPTFGSVEAFMDWDRDVEAQGRHSSPRNERGDHAAGYARARGPR